MIQHSLIVLSFHIHHHPARKNPKIRHNRCANILVMFTALYSYGVPDFTCQQIPTSIIPRKYIAEVSFLHSYAGHGYHYACYKIDVRSYTLARYNVDVGFLSVITHVHSQDCIASLSHFCINCTRLAGISSSRTLKQRTPNLPQSGAFTSTLCIGTKN